MSMNYADSFRAFTALLLTLSMWYSVGIGVSFHKIVYCSHATGWRFMQLLHSHSLVHVLNSLKI